MRFAIVTAVAWIEANRSGTRERQSPDLEPDFKRQLGKLVEMSKFLLSSMSSSVSGSGSSERKRFNVKSSMFGITNSEPGEYH